MLKQAAKEDKKQLPPMDENSTKKSAAKEEKKSHLSEAQNSTVKSAAKEAPNVPNNTKAQQRQKAKLA